MDVKLLYYDEFCKFSEFEHYAAFVSEERRIRLSQIKHDSDRLASLFAELLARSEISQRSGIPQEKIEFGYGEHGKPFLVNDPGHHFSLSHSGGYVAFAQSGAPLGVDIQLISRPRTRIAEKFFTKEEFAYIKSASDADRAFFHVWTRKEAYLKMLGTGISIPLNSFDVLSDMPQCRLLTQSLGGFMLSVCTADMQEHSIYTNEIGIDKVLGLFTAK